MTCHKDVPDDGMFVQCTVCRYYYHLGKCYGVTPASFRSKGDSLRSSWACSTCEAARKKSGLATVPGASLTDSTDRKLQELNEKFALLLPLVAKVDALSEVIKKVNDIEKAVAHVSDQYDTILSKLNKQANDVVALKKRVDGIESGSSSHVRQMRILLNELEQYSIRHNIEVRGIVEGQHDNLLEKMNDLACKLELPELAQSDLDALHRLPSRPGKESVVIARFASMTLKESWIKTRSALKTAAPLIQIMDNLTPMNKHLLWLAKNKGTEMGYRFTWQKNGRVMARKFDGDNVIYIRDETDLKKMT